MDLDPHWSAKALCLNPPTECAEKTNDASDAPNSIAYARCKPSNKLSRYFALVVCSPQKLLGVGLQGWDISSRARKQRKAPAKSDNRSGDDGGHDGNDEGQCCHDGTTDSYHGLDQCLLLRIRD